MSIKLKATTGGGSVALDAPNATTGNADVVLTLPVDDGTSGQVLQTDGAGALSFTDVSGLPDAIDVNASAPADSLAIDSSGRIGIGTISPDSPVHIKGTSQTFPKVETTSSTNDAGWKIKNGTREWSTFVNGSDGAYRIYDETATSERMRIDSNGKAYLGGNYGSLPASFGANGGVINITFNEQAGGNPGDYYGIISFNSASSSAYHYQFYTGTTQVGNILCSTSSTSYNTSSDYRLKENIVDLDGAIDRVKQLAPKRFNFTVDPGNIVDGFLAHEAKTVVPEAVTGAKDEVEVWKEGDELPDGVSVGDNKLDEDGNPIPKYQGIDQSKLVPLLTAALQEAIAKIEALETANASLEARLTALEGGAS